METQLRPLSLGEILDRTAQLYRENFVLLAGISAINAGVVLVLSLVNIGLAEAMHLDQLLLHPQWLPLTFYGLYVLFMAAAMTVVAGISVAANNRSVAWLHLGEPASIRGAYKSILPRLRTYIWLMILLFLIIWTPVMVLYGGFFGTIYLYLKPLSAGGPGQSQDMAKLAIFGVISLVFLLLILGAFVYALLMTLRYSLSMAACVVENLTARKAMRRSVELSRGSKGRIFVLGLLVAAIEIILVAITQIFFLVAAFKSHGQLSVSLRVLQQVIGFFTNTLIGPVYATGLTLFYYDQRVRKEGYDIEWMMQAAGLTVPEPAMPEQPAEPWLALDAHFEPPAPAQTPPEATPEAETPHE